MRTIVILALSAFIAGCATDAERSVQQQREVERMMAVFGPACQKLGFGADSDRWRDCVLRLSAQDSFERYSRAPSTTTCFGGHHGFLQCTSF
jgi:hypothetical protein